MQDARAKLIILDVKHVEEGFIITAKIPDNLVASFKPGLLAIGVSLGYPMQETSDEAQLLPEVAKGEIMCRKCNINSAFFIGLCHDCYNKFVDSYSKEIDG